MSNMKAVLFQKTRKNKVEIPIEFKPYVYPSCVVFYDCSYCLAKRQTKKSNVKYYCLIFNNPKTTTYSYISVFCSRKCYEAGMLALPLANLKFEVT